MPSALDDDFAAMVREALGERAPARVGPDTSLAEVGTSSLAVLALAAALEDHYDVILPDGFLNAATLATAGSLWSALGTVMDAPEVGSPRTVVFDCGETLVDETGQWTTWAGWLGVPPFTLMATVGGLLERGIPVTEAFDLFVPGFDIDAEIERRVALGQGVRLSHEDLHHDVQPAMKELTAAGVRLCIAGTMTADEQCRLSALGLPVAAVVSHSELGHRNSSPEFFTALALRLGTAPEGYTYVGHRLDTSYPAATAAGTPYVYLVRGPKAFLARSRNIPLPEPSVRSLGELAALIAAR
jgi:FMN hydrolase / 5-amino-6-(5-phospho-D-ribitylamino)uracil phosphatase